MGNNFTIDQVLEPNVCLLFDYRSFMHLLPLFVVKFIDAGDFGNLEVSFELINELSDLAIALECILVATHEPEK
jgi:hypothetical protein